MKWAAAVLAALWCCIAKWAPQLLRFLLTVGVAVSLPALAQPRFTGNYVPQSQYQTTANLSLFVDPTGNDNGTCLAAGASACATPAGAIARIPYRVRHTVTVTVAAGTYASLKIQNLSLETGGSITFNGPTTDVVPTTGTATGTLTAVANTTDAPPVVTDSAQSWTVNEFRGQFLEMTNGTANNVRRVIISNTATTLTLASGYLTAPSVGNTYAIRTPGAIVSGTGLPLSVKSIGPGGGSATSTAGNQIVISRIGATSTQTPCAIDSSNSRVVFDRVRCIATANGFVGMNISNNSAPPSFSNVYAEATNVAAFTLSNSPLAFLNSSFARSGTSTSGVVSFGPNVDVTGTGLSVEATNVAGHGIDLSGVGTRLAMNTTTALNASTNVICPAGSTSSGIYNPSRSATLGFFEGNTIAIGSFNTFDCQTGVYVSGRSNNIVVAGSNVVGALVGFSVVSGGGINFAGVTPTFSGVTDELMLDSTPSTFAAMLTGILGLSTSSSLTP